MPRTIEHLGKSFIVCQDGFLVNSADWCPEWVDRVRLDQGIELSDEHQCVLAVARAYYEKNNVGPTTRILCEAANISMREMFDLFPFGRKRSVCKMAGIPIANIHG